MTQPWQYPKGPELKKLVPEAALAIVNELVALANDLDEMGEAKVAETIDKQIMTYKTAMDKLYGITGETGEQLVGDAHPGGGPVQVPAKDEGGKVETIVEQQKKSMEAATSVPTGKQAAFVARQLVSLANRLDMEGKTEAALLVDKTLAELKEGSARPFVVKAGQDIVTAIQALLKLLDAFGEELGTSFAYEVKPAVDALVDFKDNIFNAQKSNGQKEAIGRILALEQFLFLNYNSLIKLTLKHGSSTFGERGITAGYQVSNAIGDVLKAIQAARRSDYYLFRELERAKAVPGGSTPERAKAVPGGTPIPQAGKPEQKPKSPVLQPEPERDMLSHTVKDTIDSFKAAQVGQNRAKLFKVFGGMERTLTIKQVLEKIQINLSRYSEIQAAKVNNFVWNKIYMPLKDAGLSVRRAALESALLRQAQDVPPEFAGSFGKPGKPSKPGTKPGADRLSGKPGKPFSQDLKQLQRIMLNIGIDLPIHRDDGRWGPETYQAWNVLRQNIIQRNGNDIGPPTSGAGPGPRPEVIRNAINLARQLGRLYSSQTTVHIADGVTVPERSLVSAQALIKALVAQPNSGVLAQGTPREQAAAALKIAQAYRQQLELDDSEETWALTREGGPAAVSRRADILDRLIGQLKAMEVGIPSYKMPGGTGDGSTSYRRPGTEGGGRGGREPGGLGRLEGPGGEGSGGGGTAGPAGRRGEPQMSLEARVYNVPDLSGYVNDPRGFVRWADAYLSKLHEAEGGMMGNPWRAAYSMLERIGKQIAQLETEVSTAAMGDRLDFLGTLRQRREALDDVWRNVNALYRAR